MSRTGFAFAAILAAAAFTLGACGGGGGSKPTVSMPQTPAPTRQSVAAADPERTLRAARAVTRNLPRFGSVTQSTNAVNGITTDRARVNLDPAAERVRVTVERQGKDPLILDSNDAIGDPVRGERGPPNVIGLASANARMTNSEATISATVAAWSTTEPDDGWVARGYWLYIAGQNLLSTAPTVTGFEMGAFVDGSEFSSPPELPPTRMTARYDGNARGAMVVQYGTIGGSSGPVRPQGTSMIADWRGPAKLTANFNGADSTVSGCIGCTGNIIRDEWLVSTPGGRITADARQDVEMTHQLHLGSTSINQDGTFRGKTVTLSQPDVSISSRNPIMSSSGSWGGKFSSILRGEVPHGIGGTVGGRAEWRDGTEAIYVGTFLGVPPSDPQ